MSNFLKWHPSSFKAEELYANAKEIRKLIYEEPHKGIKLLETKWNFGHISEVWDDFVFETCIRPVLDRNLMDEIKSAVQRYSIIDHALFKTYIRREEDPIRFRRAFWNLNFYGKAISKQLFKNANLSKNDTDSEKNISFSRLKIAFVLKGPYKLAHVEFLNSFLRGSSVFAEKVEIHLILIDAEKSSPKGIDHVQIYSLSHANDPYAKINLYIDYCSKVNFDHICWVACIQNLSMYMGMQLAKTQSYWSMKYHSIIMPSIKKYAGLGFGGESFYYDDTKWFRGRAFPDLQMPNRDPNLTEKLRSSYGVSKDSLLVGCFVRAEKLHDKGFWDSIITILESSSDIHFAIASQSIPQKYLSVLKTLPSSISGRFHSLGWVNTKNWAFALDVYFDSSPRGSCNTIFEAIEADVPVLLADSTHNRESSAYPYLASAANSLGLGSDIPGVFSSEIERLSACLDLLLSSDKRNQLAFQQKKLLKSLQGQQYVFAKDYLNYFLDKNFQLSLL